MSSAPEAVPVPVRDEAPGQVLPESRPGLLQVQEQALRPELQRVLLQKSEPVLQEPVLPL